MYELFGYQVGDGLVNWPIVILLGLVVDVLAILLIGKVIDVFRKRRGYSSNKYYIKLPTVLIITILVLSGLTLIDNSCA